MISGASFAEALGMMVSSTKPKKKSYKDFSPSNSFSNDVSPLSHKFTFLIQSGRS